MDVWDFKARVYHLREMIWPFSRVLSSELSNLHYLLKQLNLCEAHILDAATGTGTTLNLLPEAARITAVDRSFRMLKQARRRSVGANFVQADISSLPFQSGVFDVVTAVGIFEYQREPAGFLNALKPLVKPAGHILLTFARKNWLNRLRSLTGHYVRTMSFTTACALINHCGLTIRSKKESFMQTQIWVSAN